MFFFLQVLGILAQCASPRVVSALSSYLGHISMFLEMSNHFLKGLIENITFLWQQKSHTRKNYVKCQRTPALTVAKQT